MFAVILAWILATIEIILAAGENQITWTSSTCLSLSTSHMNLLFNWCNVESLTFTSLSPSSRWDCVMLVLLCLSCCCCTHWISYSWQYNFYLSGQSLRKKQVKRNWRKGRGNWWRWQWVSPSLASTACNIHCGLNVCVCILFPSLCVDARDGSINLCLEEMDSSTPVTRQINKPHRLHDSWTYTIARER